MGWNNLSHIFLYITVHTNSSPNITVLQYLIAFLDFARLKFRKQTWSFTWAIENIKILIQMFTQNSVSIIIKTKWWLLAKHEMRATAARSPSMPIAVSVPYGTLHPASTQSYLAKTSLKLSYLISIFSGVPPMPRPLGTQFPVSERNAVPTAIQSLWPFL
jgi:hypothetical protein